MLLYKLIPFPKKNNELHSPVVFVNNYYINSP